MAEEQPDFAVGGGAEQETQQAQVSVQHVYLKDCSFEAPGAITLDKAEGEPEMSLNLAQRVQELNDQRFEVVLTVTVTAKQGDKTAFLAEVHYAGVFQFSGFTEEQMPVVLNVLCPNVLFPYCRTQVAALISAGGFFAPPLQPINFEALFARRMREQGANQADGPALN